MGINKNYTSHVTMTTDPDELISNWVTNNSKGCEIIASAALYAFFNELDPNGDRRVFNFQKDPDLMDVFNEVVEAIRSTGFAREVETRLQIDAGSYWT